MPYNMNPYMQGGYQPQMYQQPVNGLVRVTGMEGARAYQLPPNSSIALFDGTQDLMYIKTTDAAGYPTIRTFRFEPAEQPQAPQANFVTREDFDALVAKVEALQPKPRARKAASDGE
jgi:hypothetical protein